MKNPNRTAEVRKVAQLLLVYGGEWNAEATDAERGRKLGALRRVLGEVSEQLHDDFTQVDEVTLARMERVRGAIEDARSFLADLCDDVDLT